MLRWSCLGFPPFCNFPIDISPRFPRGFCFHLKKGLSGTFVLPRLLFHVLSFLLEVFCLLYQKQQLLRVEIIQSDYQSRIGVSSFFTTSLRFFPFSGFSPFTFIGPILIRALVLFQVLRQLFGGHTEVVGIASDSFLVFLGLVEAPPFYALSIRQISG